MGTILLKLAGPLQSWGAESRFTERKTRHEPTKSGVVGMLAAALGRRREEPISDLACLPIAVRIDQPGGYEKDFQTAHTQKFDKNKDSWVFDKSLPLSNRYYLSDAVFVVGVQMPDEMLPAASCALLHPAFPLFLGRRSCPPAGKVLIGAYEGVGLMEALSGHPWEATSRALKYGKREQRSVECVVLRDRLPSDGEGMTLEMVRDYPVSFSQEHRLYEWRTVVHTRVEIPNPFAVATLDAEHDPMKLLEEE